MNTSLKYRPDIDGMRAIAVLSVIGFHCFPLELSGGFAGVDIFFVISGFLITGILIPDIRGNDFSFFQFYSRRVRRIFPALLIVILTSFIFGWFVLTAVELKDLARYIAGGAAFVANLVIGSQFGYFDPPAITKPLLHLWSLGVEEQFYLAWPAILFLLAKRRAKFLPSTLFLLIASFSLNAFLMRTFGVTSFYSSLTRFWELSMGSVLACFAQQGKLSSLGKNRTHMLSLVGLSMIFIAVLGFFHSKGNFWWWNLIPTLGAFLLILAGPQNFFNRRLLSALPLRSIGKVSYPLYLWHWPLLSYSHVLALGEPSLQIKLGVVLASLILATLTYRFVERPIRSDNAIGAPALAGMMLSLFALGLFAYKNDGLDFRFPAALRRYANYEYDYGKVTFSECSREREKVQDSRKPVLLVWGDSHAGALTSGIDSAFGSRYAVKSYSKSACPPVIGLGLEDCKEENLCVLEKVKELMPEKVLLFAVWSHYTDNWARDQKRDPGYRLQETIAELKKQGVGEVLVLGPSPLWKHTLPSLLFEAAMKDPPFYRIPKQMSYGLDSLIVDVDRDLKILLADQPVVYFSLQGSLCKEGKCRTQVGDDPDTVLAWDYGHFTRAGAEYVAALLPMK